MIEIGKSKIVPVRFRREGRLVPQLDSDGNPVTKTVSAEVIRRTRYPLNGHFGRDHGRKLVIRLRAGDVVEIWPLGTRQRYSAEIKHIFARMVRNRALREQLEKARTTKARKQARRERRRLADAERRIFAPAV
jgi:hypothetical protein